MVLLVWHIHTYKKLLCRATAETSPTILLYSYKNESNDLNNDGHEEVLDNLNCNKATLYDIGTYSLNICKYLEYDSEYYTYFDWINDEMYLVNEGIKDKPSSYSEILRLLNKIVIDDNA